MAANTTSTVQGLLRELGPTRASVLSAKLECSGISAAAARQRVSRAAAPVQRLKGVVLPNRERFLYLADQFNTELFWRRFIAVLDESNSSYGYAANSLLARGEVSLTRFPAVTGSPNDLTGHIPAATILKRLCDIQFCEIGNGQVRLLPSTVELGAFGKIGAARNQVEQILLGGVADWLKKMGFVSFNRVEVVNEATAPQFSHFNWDLVAPSYLSPLIHRVSGSPPKPGFMVADVCLTEDLSASQVEYFVNKCSIIRSLRRARPFIAFLLADSFELKALRRGNENGLVFVTPDNLFGQGTRSAFRALLTTLQNAAKVAASNPTALADLLEKLTKIEGAAGNVRGALFELIVAHAVKQCEGGSIDVGREVTVPNTGERVEIDVLNWKPRIHVLTIECKGYGSNVTIDDVEILDWLNRKVPRIQKWLRSQDDLRVAKPRFEFWTSGAFTPAAVALLKKSMNNKFALAWKDGSDVEKYLQKISSRRLKDVFQEQYRKHPLASADETDSRSD